MLEVSAPTKVRRSWNQAAFDYRYCFRKVRQRAKLTRRIDQIATLEPESGDWSQRAMRHALAEWQQTKADCDHLAKAHTTPYYKALRSLLDRGDPDPLAKPFVARFEASQRWNQ